MKYYFLFLSFLYSLSTTAQIEFESYFEIKTLRIDFILSGDKKKVSLFLRDFSIARDVSLLALAERNAGCCDLDYLKLIVNNYKEFKAKGTDTPYNATVFNVLYRFNEYACI